MRDKRTLGCVLGALSVLLMLGVAPAQANRELLTGYHRGIVQGLDEEVIRGKSLVEAGFKGGLEGACGLSIGSDQIYISSFYLGSVDVFSFGGVLQGRIGVPVADPLNNLPEGPCGLAITSGGEDVYVNVWHQRVLRLKPSIPSFEVNPKGPNRSTGVAVDDSGDVYVNDRTYIAVYEPSGAPVLEAGEPLWIGLGSLGDAYGLAVFEGKVYVPDAADDTVKVFDPAVSRSTPVSTIEGPKPGTKFNSLLDAAVAVDPTTGNLLVVDNSQPGYEDPVAAIYEFDAAGSPLGLLPSCTNPPLHNCQPKSGPIDGEPSGLAVDPATGKLYVTTSTREDSNLFEYGPYDASIPVSSEPAAGMPDPASPSAVSRSSRSPAFATGTGKPGEAGASVVVQHGPVRVNFDGKLTPHVLPRHGTAPVGIAVDAKITATGGGTPPQLRRISIAINRNGHFTPTGLPICRLREIQPSTTAGALAACGPSLVGEGHFSANVKLPEQSPFPSAGKVLAFNSRLHGKPAILAHIYGTEPAPTSTVLPFLISSTRGTYGTVLEASLPEATGEWGYVTGLRMNLKRRFTYRGKARSYLSAGCPAPAGFPSAAFPLARTSFAFAGGMKLGSVLVRTCRATG